MIAIKNVHSNIAQITLPKTLKDIDFAQISPLADELISKHNKIKLIIDASDFSGWKDMSALEEHVHFARGHQHNIERIALIAGHEWQHWLVGILRILIHPEVKIFNKGQDKEAQEWIET